jgi:hypothetical protein
MKIAATRPRPILDFLSGMFTPVVNWWGFIGQVPNLIYLAIGCFVLFVIVQVLKLFKGD